MRYVLGLTFLLASTLVITPVHRALAAGEGPYTFTLDGVLYGDTGFGTPLEDTDVDFTIRILSPDKTCILYEQTIQNFDTDVTNGRYTLQIGLPTSDPGRTGDDPNHAMAHIFQNENNITATNAGCTSPYVPAAGDVRHVRLIIDPSGGPVDTVSPDMQIGAVPNAMVAETLRGIPRSQLMTLIDGSDASALHHHDGRYAQLTNSGSITMGAGQTLELGEVAGTPGGLGAGDAGKMWIDTSDSNKVKFWDGTGVVDLTAGGAGAVADVFGRTGNVVATASDYDANQIDNTPAGNIAATNVQAAIDELDSEKLGLAGGTMSADIAMGTNKITGLGDGSAAQDAATINNVNSAITANNASYVAKAGDTMTGALTLDAQNELRLADDAGGDYISFKAPAGMSSNYDYTLPANYGTNGHVLTTDGAGGLTWQADDTGGGAGTLDQSYDQGGAGAGRTITADTGAVLINGSNAADEALEVTQSGNGGGVLFENTGTGLSFRVNDEASDTSPFAIDASGSVGVGTVNPSADSLHVSLNASTNIIAETTGSFDVKYQLVHPAASNWAIGIDNSQHGFKISEGGTLGTNDHFFVAEGGNVGINNTSPGGKLHVSGGELILDGTGAYLDYKPNNTACANNEVLKWNTTNDRWECGTDATGGGAGTLDQAYDVGGAGAGRTITADSGAVLISGSNAAAKSFEVFQSGNGGGVHFENTGSGDTFRVNDEAADTTPFIIRADGKVGIGTATPSAHLHLINTTTDATGVGFNAKREPEVTANGAIHSTSVLAVSSPNILTGVTNSSYARAFKAEAMRNYAQTTDEGTLSSLSGVYIDYGHYNTDAGDSPVTTTATGITISPRYFTGSITNMYDIYISPDSTGGTVTNRFGIYQANTAKNYFAGNVGIGTTSPTANLDVAGNIRIRANTLPGSPQVGAIAVDSGDGNKLKFYDGTWNEVALGTGTTSLDNAYDNGSTVTVDGTGGDVIWNLTNNEDFRIQDNGTDAFIVDDSGNVGIKTSSPTEALELNGVLELAGGETADEARIHFAASDKSNRFVVETDLDASVANDLLGFRSVSSDNILVLKGDGKVGIGLTAPTQRLHLAGDMKISGNTISARTSALRIFKDVASFNDGTNPRTGALVIATNAPRGNQMNSFKLRGFNYNSASSIIDLTISSYWYTTAYTWNSRAYVNNGTYQPSNVRIGVDGSDNVVYIIGDVADTWHYSRFHIDEWLVSHGGVNDDLLDNVTMSFETSLAAYSNLATITESTPGTSTSLQIADDDGDTKIQTEESTDEDILRFDTAGTERMVINDSGFVGIGTSNPTVDLDVDSITAGNSAILRLVGAGAGHTNAHILMESTNSTNGRALGTYMYDRPADFEWYVGTPYSTDDAFMIARQDSQGAHATNTATIANSLFYITNTGRIGIGTTSPSTQFHISDATNSTNLRYSSSAGTSTLMIGEENNDSGNATLLLNGDDGDSTGSDYATIRHHGDTGNLVLSTAGGDGTAEISLVPLNDVVIDSANTYLRYEPGSTPCANNEVLKWDDTNDRWICGTDNTGGGAGTLDQAYDVGGAGAGRTITADTGAVLINGSNAADEALEITQSGNGGAMLVENTGSGATFRANDEAADTTPFLIDGDGNVGVGTGAPTKLLDLSRNAADSDTMIRVSNTDASSGVNTGLRLENGTDQVDIFLQGVGQGRGAFFDSDGTGGLYFRQKNNSGGVQIQTGATPTTKFVVQNGGNVGVGTTSPSSLLEINSSSNSGTILELENTDTGGKRWGLYSSASTNTGGAGNFLIWNQTDGGTIPFAVNSSTNNVGIYTATPHASAALDVTSTDKGFLPPRMTTGQRTGISSPAEGLTVFDTNENSLYVYQSGAWAKVANSEDVSFRVNSTGGQAISGSTWTTVSWDVEEMDSNSNFASNRFTPTVAGKYYLNAHVRFWAPAANSTIALGIHKNGVMQHYNTVTSDANSGGVDVSGVYEANGSTDYFDIRVWISPGPSTIYTSGSTNVFSGFLISGGTGGGGGSDNLGNHTATQNITLGSHYLSGDGDAEGIQIDASGNVSLAQNLTLTGNVDMSGATIADNSISLDDLDFGSAAGGLNIPQLAADPGSATEGQMYYNTVSDVLKVYANGSWVDVGSSTTPTGTVFGTPSTSYSFGTNYTAPSDGIVIASARASSTNCQIQGDINTVTMTKDQALNSSGKAGISFPVKAGDDWKIGSGGTGCDQRTVQFMPIVGPGSGTLTDLDGDTKIEVEEFTDEDIIRFDTAGTERMVISATGNVGIGTSSPTSNLTISSNAAAPQASLSGTDLHMVGVDSGSTRILMDAHGNGTSAAPNVTMRSSGGTAATPTATSQYDVLGQVSYFGYGATGYASAARGFFRGEAANNWDDSNQGVNLIFGTTPDDSTTTYERMRILHNGNVGIGTATPGSKLDVRDSDTPVTLSVINENTTGGAIYPTIQVSNYIGSVGGHPVVGLRSSRGSIGSPTALQAGDHVGGIVWTAQTGAATEAQVARIEVVANTNYTGSANPAHMRFSTADSTGSYQERLRIDSDGDIGIGTTSPDSDLHIQSEGSTANIKLQSYGSYNNVHFIRANGTVASPSAVQNGDTITEIMSTGYGGTGFLTSSAAKILMRAEENWTDSTGAAHMAFYTRASGTTSPSLERVRITGDGRVGIGEPAPESDLHVRDTSNNAYITIEGPSGSYYTGIYYKESTTTRWQTVLQHSTDRFIIWDQDNDHGVYLNQNSTSWSAASDVRLKKNIEEISVLDRLKNFRAVSYEWKHDESDESRELGVIAQEFFQIFPELVSKGDDKETVGYHDPGTWGVSYDRMGALALQGLKELDNKCDMSAEQLSSVSERLENAERDIATLRAEFEAETKKLRDENQMLKDYLCTKDPAAPFCN